ncbi:MAG: CopG family transcriptional regulator [Fidelibacterota bacterium]
MEKHYRINITLPGSISEELDRVAKELNDKKSGIIVKALELYFDELDIIIAEKRFKELEEGNEELVQAEEVWKDLGLD